MSNSLCRVRAVVQTSWVPCRCFPRNEKQEVQGFSASEFQLASVTFTQAQRVTATPLPDTYITDGEAKCDHHSSI